MEDWLKIVGEKIVQMRMKKPGKIKICLTFHQLPLIIVFPKI